ncbi:division/cell wall cluster transcriptional repressor MraZ [Patescibacteria group bacterium]
MLLGTYRPNLISKNRLALPMKLRKEVTGKRLVLAIGFDKCILGFEEKKWQEVTASDLSRPISDPEGRDLRRKMFSGATVIELGVQGRFVIPDVMAEYAQINKKVVLVGAGDHFEIWDEGKWQAYSKKLENN